MTEDSHIYLGRKSAQSVTISSPVERWCQSGRHPSQNWLAELSCHQGRRKTMLAANAIQRNHITEARPTPLSSRRESVA
ncbi:hypothetical protein IVB18_11140 [Bradyrhizobium sp. 186]|uniref:hypothetical protein n=1 Tax=Bradyrhizobium sp. 186 TaxID=2782654 RepID=UPI0020017A0F|nr:hypothetical protein [Bradyrhizobium sp. 186]UPK37802.1 hypothetical protein IVB18_11140 [Bradyrhizobium sp. 186]